MQIAIPLYDEFTALDAVGPYEVLSRLPGARVRFIGAEQRAYVTDNGMLRLLAEATLDEVPDPEIICVPGGLGTDKEIDGPITAWIRAAHPGSQWTTSVCTGSILLGAAGVLEGLAATTHWLELEHLREFGATPTSERVVEQGKVITSAGVSSGIDMALTLAARIAGDDVAKAIQLGIEYDPQPPFDSGSVEKAPPHITELIRTLVAARGEGAAAQA